MKKDILLFTTIIYCLNAQSQPIVINKTPCSESEVQSMPALYYNHTKPKYGGKMIIPRSGFTEADVTKIFSTLNNIEKMEENSRKNFQATGCVMRVSYSKGTNNTVMGFVRKNYSYQLGLYQMVCHVQQHVVKEVDEYRSVLRVNVNPTITTSPITVGTGSLTFNKTPGTLYWTYDFPTDAKLGPGYEKDRVSKPSRVSTYFSEQSLLQGRSDNYKDYHTDFLKLNNGNGYVENWMSGGRYDTHTEKSYQWIDRHYLITQPGIPLLIPVSRKQYFQDMLEYLEIEKSNFNYTIDDLVKKSMSDNSDFANQKRKTWQAHKIAYAEIYEARKTKLKELLKKESEEWLQKPAIVAGGNKTKDANDRLKETGKCYDKESENVYALYQLNPAYWTKKTTDPTQPVLFEVQLRYEIGEQRQWSQKFMTNFTKNFDLETLKKMLN